MNSNISKQIHDQQETSLCWAFALSTMLRSSLIVYFRSKTNLAISKSLAKSFTQSNEFHKRLRQEIIMMPIPKPSVIKHKMLNHSTPEKLQDDVIAKQSHSLKLAILRVSSMHYALLVCYLYMNPIYTPLSLVFHQQWIHLELFYLNQSKMFFKYVVYQSITCLFGSLK